MRVRKPLIILAPITAGSLAMVMFAGCYQPSSFESSPAAATGEVAQAASGSTCITIARGVNGVVWDAVLNRTQPDKAFGTTGSLTAGVGAGVERASVIGFDLSAIPAGASVVSATLNLFQLIPSGVAKPVRVHRATAAWSEPAVTWNSFGAAAAPAVEALIPPVAAYSPTSADVTALVRQWGTSCAPNDGMYLERDTDGATVYATSEGILAQHPSLTVCYTENACAGQPDGAACDDGDACTTGDVCQAGACTGAAVSCAGAPCSAGVCDRCTGQCSAPAPVADGTPCDDGDTQTSGSSTRRRCRG